MNAATGMTKRMMWIVVAAGLVACTAENPLFVEATVVGGDAVVGWDVDGGGVDAGEGRMDAEKGKVDAEMVSVDGGAMDMPGQPDMVAVPDMTTLPDLIPVVFASCEAVKDADPAAKDGPYTLHVGGDPSKPWTAYCHDMDGKPAEYLTLVMTGKNLNFSQYTAGGSSPGVNVRTNYEKIRIDPKTLLVDVSDQTFSTSAGGLMNSGGPFVTSMPYGVAMDCAPQGFGIPTGMGNVDLRGTPFGVKAGVFVLGPPASGRLCGEATYLNNDQTVSLKGGGNCGFIGGGDYGHWGVPFTMGTFQMQLEYL